MSSFYEKNKNTYVARIEVLREVCGELPLGDVVEVEDKEEDEDDTTYEAVHTEDQGCSCNQIIRYPVERLYCKRPLLCLSSSKILTLHPPHRPPASVYPAFGAGGGHTRRVEKGGGGQYFGRRETQLGTLHM
jgi:hypothetical protein